MAAPVNMTPKEPDTSNWTPDEIARWNEEAAQWKTLNPGNPDFHPLTVKAGYVIGVIYDICESVSCLLKDSGFARRTSYIPAYGIFASGVEILGRCVKGEPKSYRSTLCAGFKWLADPTPSSYQTVSQNRTLVTTSQRAYTIEELVYLRNFAAHGQAAAQFCNIDYELLSRLHPLLTAGLEHYWTKLTMPGNDELSTNLARANVVGLRDWPVFKCWSLFSRDRQGKHHSVTEIFNKFKDEWKV